MSEDVSHLPLTEVAKRAEVRLSAVSNWRVRHADFPKPRVVSGQEVFDEDEVVRWLNTRKIPRNRLKPGEKPGTSYGDRFLFNSAIGAAPIATAAGREKRDTKPDWEPQLWTAVDRLRGTHGAATALTLLLGLVYVRTCRTDTWQSLIDAADWPRTRDLLAQVSLPLGTGEQSVPVFGTVAHTADPSVVEAVRLVDRIDFSGVDGPQSTAAQIADALLGNLERGMGRSGGRFTPSDVARCLVELLDPQPTDRVYDPFCGSGELLCAAAEHVSRQRGSLDGWQVWGQTPQDWSWLTSRMNLALHGVEADLNVPASALEDDRFPGRRFNRVLANPPFNLRMESLPERAWPFGEPPAHNANFAWLQHIVTKLEPDGRAAVVMPVSAASVSAGSEPSIRKKMIEAGIVECVISLPPQLFRFTAIPTMVWILSSADAKVVKQETLFLDARDLGQMVDRTERKLAPDDIRRIADEYRQWRACPTPRDFARTDGFSRSVSHDEISENDYILTPARYTVSAAKRLDTVRVTADLRALREKFDDLSSRAEEVRSALDARLEAVLTGEQPDGDGKSVPLGSVCDVLPGPGTVARSGHDPFWTPLVLPRNIRHHRVGAEELDVVSPSTAERMARYRLVAGDIVTARTGTLGRYGLVRQEQAGWLLGPGCVRFRPNGEVDPDYLTYYLDGPDARQWLIGHATGSAVQHINAATLRKMPIWLPPLQVQRMIAGILNSFHDAASTHDLLSTTARQLHEMLVPMLMPPLSTDALRDG